MAFRPALLGGAVLLAAAATTVAVGFELSRSESEAASWTRVASMSQRRSYIAAAQIGPFLYAAGGMVGETGRPLATFTRYDSRSDSWETLEPLPQPTRAAAAAADDGLVYVIGGTTPDGNTRSVLAWDGRGWKERAPLPEPRFNHAAVALDGRIYVLGGFAGLEEHADVFV